MCPYRVVGWRAGLWRGALLIVTGGGVDWAGRGAVVWMRGLSAGGSLLGSSPVFLLSYLFVRGGAMGQGSYLIAALDAFNRAEGSSTHEEADAAH